MLKNREIKFKNCEIGKICRNDSILTGVNGLIFDAVFQQFPVDEFLLFYRFPQGIFSSTGSFAIYTGNWGKIYVFDRGIFYFYCLRRHTFLSSHRKVCKRRAQGGGSETRGEKPLPPPWIHPQPQKEPPKRVPREPTRGVLRR